MACWLQTFLYAPPLALPQSGVNMKFSSKYLAKSVIAVAITTAASAPAFAVPLSGGVSFSGFTTQNVFTGSVWTGIKIGGNPVTFGNVTGNLATFLGTTSGTAFFRAMAQREASFPSRTHRPQRIMAARTSCSYCNRIIQATRLAPVFSSVA